MGTAQTRWDQATPYVATTSQDFAGLMRRSHPTATVPHGQEQVAPAPTPSPYSPSCHDPRAGYEQDPFFKILSDMPKPFRLGPTVSVYSCPVASKVVDMSIQPNTVSVYTFFETVRSDHMKP